MGNESDDISRDIFTSIPEENFPFSIRAWHENPFEIAWEIEVSGPGALQLPGAEKGRPITRIDILDKDGEVVYRHEAM